MASRCLAAWASLMSDKVMPIIAKQVVPRLEAGGNDLARQGALEAVWCIVDRLGLNLLPYIVLLVVPVLGRMSDQQESVRMLASLTFATLVRLMPLEGGVPDPPNLPADLTQQKGEQREFLEQLLNPSKIPKYEITVPINAELRPYQQSGVNWLGFLSKFKLHGILCDDMGLGKTLQSICILGSDHKECEERYQVSSYILIQNYS
jgi:TATA-binding protein-associated factor